MVHNRLVMKELLEATTRAEDEHFWFKGLRRHAAAMLDRAAAGRTDLHVVDCGAGTGRNLDWLRAYGWAVGVEYSPTGVAIGRAAGRRLVQGTVLQLPFADASMDIATSFDVLYCFDDAEEARAVAEMARVLRPGGWALVNVAALKILSGGHSALGLEKRRYTRQRLQWAMEQGGFQVDRLSYTNMPTFPITLALRTFDRVSGRAAKGSLANLQVPPAPINRAFDLALRAEHAWLRRGNLPIGSSLMCLARKPG